MIFDGNGQLVERGRVKEALSVNSRALISFVHYQIEKGRSAKLLCPDWKRDQKNGSLDPFQRGFCTESVSLRRSVTPLPGKS
jgi:hypothetical protein